MEEDGEKLINIMSFWVISVSHLAIRSGLATGAHDLLNPAEYNSTTHNGVADGGSNYDEFPLDDLYDLLANPRQASSTVHAAASSGTAKQCNPTSTGTIMFICFALAVAVTVLLQCFTYNIHSTYKVYIMECLFFVGLLTMALSQRMGVMFAGVVFVGIAISCFELTIPPLATAYRIEATNAIAAGAGAAQLLGSSLYLGLKSTEYNRLEIFGAYSALILTGFTVYVVLLEYPSAQGYDTVRSQSQTNTVELTVTDTDEEEGERKELLTGEKEKTMKLWPSKQDVDLLQSEDLMGDFLNALKTLQDLVVYLVIFYVLEYFNNVGLFEHATVDDSQVSRAAQYRWFMFTYHASQFMFRSMPLMLICANQIAAVTVGMGVVCFIFLLQVRYSIFGAIWLLLLVVCVEGLLGALAYLIGLREARIRMENTRGRKMATIIVLVSEAIGIGIASTAAIPAHTYICRHTV